jgi:hypothetical protein
MLNDRSEILNRVAAGQISAEEAARLLREPAPARTATASAEALKGHWLHIRVTQLDTGASRVNVNVPLSWVDIGMRIGARYQPDIAGVDWAEVVQMIKSGANGRLVEVEDLDDNERVEIFVE